MATKIISRSANVNVASANVNVANSFLQRPLHLAVIENDIQMVCKLLDRGARMDVKDSAGHTPLRVAVDQGNIEVVNILVYAGADINSQDHECCSLLHTAVLCWNETILNFLLCMGAVVNLKDDKGQTPFHLAFHAGNIDCIKVLLRYGAEIDEVDGSGSSPLDLCVFVNNQVETVIKQHAVKVITANLKLNIANHVDINDFHQLKSLCLEELVKINNKIFGKTSLYHVFSKQMDPTYVSNKKLRTFIQSADLESEFPVYADLLHSEFKKVEKRNNLMSVVEFSVKIQFQDGPKTICLPSETGREILSYLSNEDLRNVFKKT